MSKGDRKINSAFHCKIQANYVFLNFVKRNLDD